jgi:antitoxin component HigA of HigAB toxin-antitoxin module
MKRRHFADLCRCFRSADQGKTRLLGASRNLGAMILRGERKLTLAHIRKLAARFNVSPDLFIG